MFNFFITLAYFLVIQQSYGATAASNWRFSNNPENPEPVSRPKWTSYGDFLKPSWRGGSIWKPKFPRWDRDWPIWGRTPKPAASNKIDTRTPQCELTSSPPEPESMCCGVDAITSQRIVGGNVTHIEEHPWLVQIEYHLGTWNILKTLCGGFLISGRYVLSAAHCFSGDLVITSTPVNVILGEYDKTNEGRDCVTARGDITTCTDGAIKIPIQKYRVHPKYLSDRVTSFNDIAIVMMKRTVQYTKFIRPICLPTSDITASPPKNLRFLTAGWGAVKHQILRDNRTGKWFSIAEFDEVKRDVEVPFVTLEKCREQYKFITFRHICAGGEQGKDSCKGDSGGPLMRVNNGIFEASGIVSTAAAKYACGTAERVAIYTNVYQYLDWIKENITP